MGRLRLSTVELGEVFKLAFPNSPQQRPSFMAMVTERRRGSVDLKLINLDKNGKPNLNVVGISQTELDLSPANPSRVIMAARPEYRRWVNNPLALMSFSDYLLPRVPERLTIHQFVQHQNGRFILTDKAPNMERDTTALYRQPFYDHLNEQVIRQHVTVFGLAGNALMQKRLPQPAAQEWWPVVPEGVGFTKLVEGPVASCLNGMLVIGATPATQRSFALSEKKIFGIETSALVRAGLASR